MKNITSMIRKDFFPCYQLRMLLAFCKDIQSSWQKLSPKTNSSRPSLCSRKWHIWHFYIPCDFFMNHVYHVWAGTNQHVHWFLGGKGLGIQHGMSVWVGLPKSRVCVCVWEREREREREDFEDHCPWALSLLVCGLDNGFVIDSMTTKYIDLGSNTQYCSPWMQIQT
jgi:hypothetical protein